MDREAIVCWRMLQKVIREVLMKETGASVRHVVVRTPVTRALVTHVVARVVLTKASVAATFHVVVRDAVGTIVRVIHVVVREAATGTTTYASSTLAAASSVARWTSPSVVLAPVGVG